MKQNKQMLNEVRRMQQLAGIKPIVEMDGMMDDSMNDDTITVDGMTGTLISTIGDTKLYSSESTEVDSNFDYFLVQGGGEPQFVSIETPGEEIEISARYIRKVAGIKNTAVAQAIADDMIDELGSMDEGDGTDMGQTLEEMGGQSYAAMSQDRGDTGSSIEFTVTNDMGDKAEIEYMITPNSQARPRFGSRLGAGSREPQSGMAMVAKQDWITVNGTSFGPIKWH